MLEKEFIDKFLTINSIETKESVSRYSTLGLALKDARLIAGRDIYTGDKKKNYVKNTQSFLYEGSLIGIIGYIIILEIIGEVFERNDKSIKRKKNNITNALKRFSNLRSKDIYVLIALRNSLAHNYGLANIPKHNKEYNTKRHKFTLVYSKESELIEYPSSKWDGDFFDNSDDTETKIGIIALAELVESVINQVKSLNDVQKIELALKGGFQELKKRFTILQ